MGSLQGLQICQTLFLDQWSRLSFHGTSDTNRSTTFGYGIIVRCSCLYGGFHLTWPFFMVRWPSLHGHICIWLHAFSISPMCTFLLAGFILNSSHLYGSLIMNVKWCELECHLMYKNIYNKTKILTINHIIFLSWSWHTLYWMWNVEHL